MTFLQRPHFSCASCQAGIVGAATFHVGLPFCCAGCVAGGPCTCSYDAAPVAAVPDTRSESDGGAAARREAAAVPATALAVAVADR